jgi:hypothetical protein
MDRKERQVTREDMEGFMHLNALMADFILEQNLEGFNRWLDANDPDKGHVDVEQIGTLLRMHLIVCSRMIRVSESKLFRRL